MIPRWQDPGAIDVTSTPRAWCAIPPPKPLPHASWVESYVRPGHRTEAELAASLVAHRADLRARAMRAARKRADDGGPIDFGDGDGGEE